MISPKLLGAALLAVPLNVAAAQSAASQTSDPGSTGRALFGAQTFVWVAGIGASSAALFTAIATHHADASPSRGLTTNAPQAPMAPSAPTPVTLPWNGVTSPNQNTPGGTPSDTGTKGSDTNTSGPGALVLNDLPPESPTIPQNPTPFVPSPPPPPPPPILGVVAVTAPEPTSVALLGSGLVALIPAVRRRRS